MNQMEWCQTHFWLERKPIQYEKRPYLNAVYRVRDQNLVLRCSRQVEKSTTLVATLLFLLCRELGIKILFVAPRNEQADLFCRSRFFPALVESPFIRRYLLGQSGRIQRANDLIFANGSQLYVRSAFRTPDAARGISADVLMVDEFQDLAAGSLPVLQETMSHSPRQQTILAGTPKLSENQLELAFQQSTANEWRVPCAECEREVLLDESSLGPRAVICPGCKSELDLGRGRWVPRHPQEKVEGFWINHLMVPWLDYQDIMDRQQAYNQSLFKNEVLGLPSTLGEHVVTRAELEACCTTQAMFGVPTNLPRQGRSGLVAGIDWSGGVHSKTILVIGYIDQDYRFHVVRFDRFQPQEEPDALVREIAWRCREFGVSLFAADGRGNGLVYNRLLQQALKYYEYFYTMVYVNSEGEPRQDGSLWTWSIDRSATLGSLFSRIKKQQISFPRVSDCSSFLDEISCEIALQDDHQRRVKFTHPENQQDDTLHALNYALTLALRAFQGVHGLL